MAAWRAPATVAGQAGALRQRIQAVLSFDSWAAAPRAAGQVFTGSATRRLVFSAEGRDVELRITTQGAGFAICGQVLGRNEAGTVALAPASGATVLAQTCALDALGKFQLDSVAPRRHSLRLLLTDLEILLPTLDIGMWASWWP